MTTRSKAALMRYRRQLELAERYRRNAASIPDSLQRASLLALAASAEIRARAVVRDELGGVEPKLRAPVKPAVLKAERLDDWYSKKDEDEVRKIERTIQQTEAQRIRRAKSRGQLAETPIPQPALVPATFVPPELISADEAERLLDEVEQEWDEYEKKGGTPPTMSPRQVQSLLLDAMEREMALGWSGIDGRTVKVLQRELAERQADVPVYTGADRPDGWPADRKPTRSALAAALLGPQLPNPHTTASEPAEVARWRRKLPW